MIVKPHGGALINRILSGKEREAILSFQRQIPPPGNRRRKSHRAAEHRHRGFFAPAGFHEPGRLPGSHPAQPAGQRPCLDAAHRPGRGPRDDEKTRQKRHHHPQHHGGGRSPPCRWRTSTPGISTNTPATSTAPPTSKHPGIQAVEASGEFFVGGSINFLSEPHHPLSRLLPDPAGDPGSVQGKEMEHRGRFPDAQRLPPRPRVRPEIGAVASWTACSSIRSSARKKPAISPMR